MKNLILCLALLAINWQYLPVLEGETVLIMPLPNGEWDAEIHWQLYEETHGIQNAIAGELDQGSAIVPVLGLFHYEAPFSGGFAIYASSGHGLMLRIISEENCRPDIPRESVRIGPNRPK